MLAVPLVPMLLIWVTDHVILTDSEFERAVLILGLSIEMEDCGFDKSFGIQYAATIFLIPKKLEKH